MILMRGMKGKEAIARKDYVFNSLEISEPRNDSVNLWHVPVACVFNGQTISAYFETEAEAELFHRQLIRLLKRHEWKESS